MFSESAQNTSHTNSTEAEEAFLGLTGAAATGLSASMAVACILGAGLASGLNLCLLSLDPDATLAESSNPNVPESVRNNAKKVHRILTHQHWMLVTTLVWNAIFAESNPLILESLLGGIAAIIISTAALVIFGEIIPQSCFARYALSVAGFLSPVVWTMMIVSSPVSYPIAKLLDCVVGHRPPVAMKRVELRELIALNVMADAVNASSSKYGEGEDAGLLSGGGAAGGSLGPRHDLSTRGGKDPYSSSPNSSSVAKEDDDSAGAVVPRAVTTTSTTAAGVGNSSSVTFTQDEVALLNSALNLSEKTVRDVMRDSEYVDSLLMLEEGQVLSKDVVRKITESGRTRIPVYQNDRRNITGFIFSHGILHILFMNEATQAPKVKDCGVTAAARCNASDLVVVLFRPFLADAQDIAVVHDDHTGLPLGIVTKWDMLSFLFNDEIAAEKWGLQDAEQLAAEARAAQNKRAKRETMVLARNSVVSSGLKLVESGLPLTAPSSTSVGHLPFQSNSSGGLSPSASAQDLLHPPSGGGGGGWHQQGSRRRSATPGTAAGGSHQQQEELQYGGGRSYGTLGGGGGNTTASLSAAGGGRRSSRFGSSMGRGGGRSSHFVPGDSQRRMPSFVGGSPPSAEDAAAGSGN